MVYLDWVSKQLLNESLVRPGDVVFHTVDGTSDVLNSNPVTILTDRRMVKQHEETGDQMIVDIPPGTRFELVFPRTKQTREKDLAVAVATTTSVVKNLGHVMNGLSKAAQDALSQWDRNEIAKAVGMGVTDAVILTRAASVTKNLSPKMLSDLEPGDMTLMEFAGMTSRWVVTPREERTDKRFLSSWMLCLQGPLKGQELEFMFTDDEQPVESSELNVGDVVRFQTEASGAMWEVLPNANAENDELQGRAKERLASVRTLQCIFDNASRQADAIEAMTGKPNRVPSNKGRTRIVQAEDGVQLIRVYAADT